MVSPESKTNCDKSKQSTSATSSLEQQPQTASASVTSTSATSSTVTNNECGQQHRRGHRRQESMYAMTGLYAETQPTEEDNDEDLPDTEKTTTCCHETVVIKCHSRNPSSTIIDR